MQYMASEINSNPTLTQHGDQEIITVSELTFNCHLSIIVVSIFNKWITTSFIISQFFEN